MILLKELSGLMMEASVGKDPNQSREFKILCNKEFSNEIEEAIAFSSSTKYFKKRDEMPEIKDIPKKFIFIHGISVIIEVDEKYKFPIIICILKS